MCVGGGWGGGRLVISLTKNPHLYFFFFGGGSGWGLVNVSEQIFQMALLLFKENNCAK